MSTSDELVTNLSFCILTVGRTGSHLLADFLNSHPDIGCYGELHTLFDDREDDIRISPEVVDGDILGCILPFAMRAHLDDFDKVIFSKRYGKSHAESFAKNYYGREVDTQDVKHWQDKLNERQATAEEMLDDYIVVTYNSMTGGEDVDKMPERVQKKVLDYLEVNQQELTAGLTKGET